MGAVSRDALDGAWTWAYARVARSSGAAASSTRLAGRSTMRWVGGAGCCCWWASRGSARPGWPTRRRRWRPASVPVLWGRCWEAGGAPAYWPWLESLASWSRPRRTGAPREPGRGAALLAVLVPELRERLADRRRSPRPVVQPGGEARFRCWRAVSAWSPAAAPAGLLIVLDDLHAADEASLALAQFVARELRSMPAAAAGHLPRRRGAADTGGAGELHRPHGPRGDDPRARAAGSRRRPEACCRQRTPALEPAVERRHLREHPGQSALPRGDGPAGGRAGRPGGRGGRRAGGRARGDPPAARAGRTPRPGPCWIWRRWPATRSTSRCWRPPRGDARRGDRRSGGGPAGRGAGHCAGRRRFSHELMREVLYGDLAAAQGSACTAAVAARSSGCAAAMPARPWPSWPTTALPVRPRGWRGRSRTRCQAARRALGRPPTRRRWRLVRAAAAVEAAGNPAPLRARVLLALADARIRRGGAAPGQDPVPAGGHAGPRSGRPGPAGPRRP